MQTEVSSQYVQVFGMKSLFRQKYQNPIKQCWTVGTIFTFGRSRMFGPEKLRPLAVGRSRSRRIKKCKTCHNFFNSNHSNWIGEFYSRFLNCFSSLCAQFNDFSITSGTCVLKNTRKLDISLHFGNKPKKTTNNTFGRRNGLKLRPP